MRAFAKFFLAVSLVIVGLNAQAQQTADNFKVEASVANQSEIERVKATKNALTTLISRLVNDPAALQNADVRQAIDHAPNYLTQFNYSSDTQLTLQFSQAAVTKLLLKAQLIADPHTDSHQIVLHVLNVQDFASFKQIQSYLKSVSGVQKVQLLAVDKADMQIGLKLSGDQAGFESAIAASNKLQAATGEKVLPLSFIWHP